MAVSPENEGLLELLKSRQVEDEPQPKGENLNLVDGDSGTFDNGRRFRLTDTDTPEFHHPDYELGKEATEALLKEGAIARGTGKYDYSGRRELTDLKMPDGSSGGRELVKAGLASPTDEDGYQALMTGVARQALGVSRTAYSELNAISDRRTRGGVDLEFAGAGAEFTYEGGTFTKAVKRGGLDLKASAGGVLNYLGDQLGRKDWQAEGRRLAETSSRHASYMPREVENYQEATKSIGNALTYMVETVGEMAPGLLMDAAVSVGTLGGGLAVAGARRGVMKAAGVAVKKGTMQKDQIKDIQRLMVGGAALSGGLQSMGATENRLDAHEEGSHGLATTVSGVVGGALNAAPYEFVLGRVLKAGLGDKAAKEVTKKLKVADRGKDVAKTGAIAAGVEGIASTAQMAMDESLYAAHTKDDFTDWDASAVDMVDNTIRSVMGGGLAGSGASTVAHGYNILQEYHQNQKDTAEEFYNSQPDVAAEREAVIDQYGRMDGKDDSQSFKAAADDDLAAAQHREAGELRRKKLVDGNGDMVNPKQLESLLEDGEVEDDDLETYLKDEGYDFDSAPIKEGRDSDTVKTENIVKRLEVFDDLYSNPSDEKVDKAVADGLITEKQGYILKTKFSDPNEVENTAKEAKTIRGLLDRAEGRRFKADSNPQKYEYLFQHMKDAFIPHADLRESKGEVDLRAAFADLKQRKLDAKRADPTNVTMDEAPPEASNDADAVRATRAINKQRNYTKKLIQDAEHVATTGGKERPSHEVEALERASAAQDKGNALSDTHEKLASALRDGDIDTIKGMKADLADAGITDRMFDKLISQVEPRKGEDPQLHPQSKPSKTGKPLNADLIKRLNKLEQSEKRLADREKIAANSGDSSERKRAIRAEKVRQSKLSIERQLQELTDLGLDREHLERMRDRHQEGVTASEVRDTQNYGFGSHVANLLKSRAQNAYKAVTKNLVKVPERTTGGKNPKQKLAKSLTTRDLREYQQGRRAQEALESIKGLEGDESLQQIQETLETALVGSSRTPSGNVDAAPKTLKDSLAEVPKPKVKNPETPEVKAQKKEIKSAATEKLAGLVAKRDEKSKELASQFDDGEGKTFGEKMKSAVQDALDMQLVQLHKKIQSSPKIAKIIDAAFSGEAYQKYLHDMEAKGRKSSKQIARIENLWRAKRIRAAKAILELSGNADANHRQITQLLDAKVEKLLEERGKQATILKNGLASIETEIRDLARETGSDLAKLGVEQPKLIEDTEIESAVKNDVELDNDQHFYKDSESPSDVIHAGDGAANEFGVIEPEQIADSYTDKKTVAHNYEKRISATSKLLHELKVRFPALDGINMQALLDTVSEFRGAEKTLDPDIKGRYSQAIAGAQVVEIGEGATVNTAAGRDTRTRTTELNGQKGSVKGQAAGMNDVIRMSEKDAEKLAMMLREAEFSKNEQSLADAVSFLEEKGVIQYHDSDINQSDSQKAENIIQGVFRRASTAKRGRYAGDADVVTNDAPIIVSETQADGQTGKITRNLTAEDITRIGMEADETGLDLYEMAENKDGYQYDKLTQNVARAFLNGLSLLHSTTVGGKRYSVDISNIKFDSVIFPVGGREITNIEGSTAREKRANLKDKTETAQTGATAKYSNRNQRIMEANNNREGSVDNPALEGARPEQSSLAKNDGTKPNEKESAGVAQVTNPDGSTTSFQNDPHLIERATKAYFGKETPMTYGYMWLVAGRQNGMFGKLGVSVGKQATKAMLETKRLELWELVDSINRYDDSVPKSVRQSDINRAENLKKDIEYLSKITSKDDGGSVDAQLTAESLSQDLRDSDDGDAHPDHAGETGSSLREQTETTHPHSGAKVVDRQVGGGDVNKGDVRDRVSDEDWEKSDQKKQTKSQKEHVDSANEKDGIGNDEVLTVENIDRHIQDAEREIGAKPSAPRKESLRAEIYKILRSWSQNNFKLNKQYLAHGKDPKETMPSLDALQKSYDEVTEAIKAEMAKPDEKVVKDEPTKLSILKIEQLILKDRIETERNRDGNKSPDLAKQVERFAAQIRNNLDGLNTRDLRRLLKSLEERGLYSPQAPKTKGKITPLPKGGEGSLSWHIDALEGKLRNQRKAIFGQSSKGEDAAKLKNLRNEYKRTKAELKELKRLESNSVKTHEERLTALKSLKEKGVITDADRAMLGLPLLRPLGKLPKGDQSSDTHNVRDMSYVSPEDIQARLVQGNNISPEEMLEMTKRMLDDAPEGSTQHKLLSDQLKFIQAKIDGDTDTVNSIAADNPEAPFLDFDGFDPTFQTGPTSAADIEKASSLLREKINSPLKALNALQRLLYTMTSSIERHNPNLSKLLFTRSGNGIKGAPDFSRDSRIMKEMYESMYGEAVKGESHESIKAGLEDAATGKPESEVGKRIHAVIESFSAEIRKSNPNYKMKGLPIVVDTAVVARDPKGFQRILVSHGIKEKMATKITEAYLNSSGVGDHKIHTDNTPNPFGGKGFTEMLRPAMKDLQDAGMIESDMGVKMQRFFTSGALYANWSKTFGATDKKGVFNENAVFEYHMSLIPPEHRLRIRKQVDHITGNINFGVPSWLHQMNSATFAFSAATLLLFSGIASIPEIGVVVGRSRGDISKLQNEVVKLFKKDGRMEVLEAADDFLTTTPYVVQETISSMFGRDAFTMGQGARRITDAMFRLNGQTFITDFTRRLATHAGRKFVESHAGKALQGNAESIRALAELGIDGATVDQFIAETMHNGGQVDINTPAGAAVRDAIHRFVDESVSNPYAAQMPTWMSDPRFQMIASLKKFYYAYWDNLHRQMFSEATKRRGSGGTISAAVAPMLLAGMIMLPLAGVAELLRELVKYPGEVLTFLPEWTKRMQPVETKDRLYSLIGAMGGAAIGQTAIAAYEQNGRGRNALTHLMGPTADFGWQFLSGDVLGKHPTRMMPILNQVAFARRPVDKTWRDWLRED